MKLPLLLLSTFAFLSAVAAAKSPNIVLIVSDDHGTDALGCYGNPIIKTPALDSLAADGTLFTDANCTTASCSPSRSVILSGLHNHSNGMYGLQHTFHHYQSFDEVESLPVTLSKNGYRTARIGKFHVAPEAVYKFDTVLSTGAANDPKTIGRSPYEMSEESRPVIESDDQRPFFLFYATDDPHRSNAFTADGLPTFDTYPEPNDFGNRDDGYPGINPVVYDPAKVIVPPFLPDTPACRAEIAQYYQSVSRLDEGIGHLIDILKKSGKYDNTLILYIADNGVAFAGAKTTLYEPGMRLPLIVREPGQKKKGRTQEAMISWVDLAPTLLDYAGVDLSESALHGRSFKKGVSGKLKNWDHIFASHTNHEATMYYPMRVIKNRQYKLIFNIAHGLEFPLAKDLLQSPTWVSMQKNGLKLYGKRTPEALLHRPRIELYDLQADPHEVVNLSENPEYAKIRDSMIAQLKEFQADTRDPWGIKWERE
jgi:N-sulfoglucosamine sulfohydrolase|tara:strand:- start:2394 stop:3836 length:1443 start_codon:yes stop_codon:yes gene_type:complete